MRKFFVEAKKPARLIKADASAAYQLRRYAWSAKLPVSVLTDFEELAVYDCRQRPSENDAASLGRINFYTFDQYLDRLPEIYDVFSKDAVLRGSFDRFLQEAKAKRGTTPVDAEFLKEIEGWRTSLAKSIAQLNPRLGLEELNDAVQRTIDRIIFLRMAEDRGTEEYGQLQRLGKGGKIYAGLLDLCHQADIKYNSGLFDFTADILTPRLKIDDDKLSAILGDLYYPKSPYEFSVLGADTLGNVYEQFLGKVIRLTPAHLAKVEEKPEVKKAGGVYYTPTYIVEYIVKQTVGKMIEGKSPEEIETLRVLDPACGSGSFLLGAYQLLLDHHLAWYVAHVDEPGVRDRIYQSVMGWRLTTAEKKRILLNNIYGVDIDRQAVEVTKLSLLLKVLEGENQESLGKQLALFRERALPNLDSNIKCGNSLIGPDYFADKLLPDPDELKRVNPFDWQREFPEIMKAGGFDCVIGNPPYLFITELDDDEKRYFFDRYETSEYRFDVYGLFTELAIRKLARQGGYVSFITPHTLLSNDSFEKLRRLILRRTLLEAVIDIGPGVFQGVSNETMIFIFRNGTGPEGSPPTRVISTTARAFERPGREFSVKQEDWLNNPKAAWLTRVSHLELSVVSKLANTPQALGDLCTINQGLRTGDNRNYLSSSQKSGKWKPAVGGKHIARYDPLEEEIYVYYVPELLDAPRRPEIFDSPEKVVIQEVRNITLPRRLVATYDDQRFFCLQSTNVINLRVDRADEWRIKYLLGILNSNGANFFFRQLFSGNNHIASNQLARIPIPSAGRDQQKGVVALVDQMLELHKRLHAAKRETDRELYQRQIDGTDKEIDALVYELYWLSEDEIKIVEGGG